MNHDDGDAFFVVGTREVEAAEMAVFFRAEESFEFEGSIAGEIGEVVDAEFFLGG